MNKPITVAYEDLKSGIAELINSSGLPAFIVEPVIKDFLIEIKDVAKKQYEYDKEQYDAEVSKAQSKSAKDEEVGESYEE